MTNELEIWGGIECTVNRVGDVYHDQIHRSGHATRSGDLERIASLGIRTLRYPVLWERTERAKGDFDFAWADERLGELERLGVRPIVGLLHHGSGPRWTSLLDPGFAEGLARHAATTARRYPWVSDYTPVNEPLTTARFSALYGHWYPHERKDGAFVRALFGEVEATVLAMRAIRQVNPEARLVQTEDACTVFASRALQHQARFENERRWLSLDLLSGKVVPTHPLHAWLVACGIHPDELARLADCACPPDVIGLNYYVTSDRWLDEHLSVYPAETHGGNGRQAYADVEAVRVRAGIAGHERLLLEAWRRYGKPLALTEVHIGCTTDEQIRWFADAYRGARAARSKGADVRAVTAWALFGTYDWCSLVTRDDGRYEPGLFDLRGGGEPIATELAEVVAQLGKTGVTSSPYALAPGWWRRPERVLYDCVRCRPDPLEGDRRFAAGA